MAGHPCILAHRGGRGGCTAKGGLEGDQAGNDQRPFLLQQTVPGCTTLTDAQSNVVHEMPTNREGNVYGEGNAERKFYVKTVTILHDHATICTIQTLTLLSAERQAQ